jgi:hypothetical protein
MAFNRSDIATLSSLIKQGFKEGVKNLHTSIPGIIQSFDPVRQLANVQPAIRRIFISRESEESILTPSPLPLLINVPVIFPRGGGFSLTFPVKSGDECLLVFCERSIDNWHQYGGVKDPIARRFHDLSDATAFVGLSSMPNKVPEYNGEDTELKSDDGSVVFTIRLDGTSTLKAISSVTIDSPETTITGNLTVDGNALMKSDLTVSASTILTSNITSNGMNIGDTHTHSGSPTAPLGPISNTGIVT